MADEVDGAGDRRLGASTSSAATEGVTSKQRKTRLCPHCSDVVSRASYFRHKRDFYDYRTKQWATDTVNTCRTEVEVGGDSTPPLDDESDMDDSDYTMQELGDQMQEDDDGSQNDQDKPSESEAGNLSEEWSDLSSSSSESDSDGDDNNIPAAICAQNSQPLSAVSTKAKLIHSVFYQFFGFLILWQAAFNISNAAISAFMKFFKYFILLLGRAFNCDSLSSSANHLPINRELIAQLLNSGDKVYTEYVVCPKCDSLYEFKDCIKKNSNGTVESKTCCHVATPDHLHRSKRLACGCVLLKRQRTKKKVILTPRKVYPYMSVKKSLHNLLNRPGFVDKCELWRSRRMNQTPSAQEYLGDVYDGNVWTQDFNSFLSTPHSYLLNMNVDWFKPFVRGTTYSTGAIYLTIQNLPRHERYRQENLILVGLIPGPSEPKSMNAYLTPLVEELHELWQGVIMPVKSSNSLYISIRIKAALSCCACDVPASRKVCGFLSHNATFGCNKCFKKFSHYPSPNGGILTDYSGFDRENWPLRTNTDHRSKVVELLKERTPSALQRAESNLGLRYSLLLSLPYFDPVRFTIIDPMHNLYLGSGKHAFEVWFEKDLITKKDFPKLEELMKMFTTPYDAGRLPMSIGSGYGGFTANQWSNWITIFSPILLKEILPAEDLECWLLFVRACTLLKPRFIRKCDAESADLYLLQYCKKFQDLYGPRSITPNMHLHTHLKQCIVDYGPLHAFWCYPFERYNGILGNFHSNRRSIESQLMKKFCQSQAYMHSGVISPDIAQYLPAAADQQNLMSERSNDTDILKFLHIQSSELRHIDSFGILPKQTLVKPLQPHTTKVMAAESLQQLKCIYEQLYPTKTVAHISRFYRQYGRIALSGDVIGSVMPGRNNCQSSSVIAAYWPGSGSSLLSIDYTRKRIGVVQYFIQHSLEVYKNDGGYCDTEKVQHLFCFIQWKKQHPNADWFGMSAIVCDDCYESQDACCFMPVQRIANKCAFAKINNIKFDSYEDSVFVACPIPIKY